MKVKILYRMAMQYTFLILFSSSVFSHGNGENASIVYSLLHSLTSIDHVLPITISVISSVLLLLYFWRSGSDENG